MNVNEMVCGTYEHYKAKKLYEVIGVARHSETGEELVVYKALYRSDEFELGQIWVRPKKMFFEEVLYEGQVVLRFKKIMK